MVLAYDYPFWDLMGTMLVFFFWVIWIWILIDVFADLFRRHDIGGGAKVLWMIFVIFLPYLGVFIYLISQSSGMAERKLAREREAEQQFAGYVQNAAASGGGGCGGRDREGQGPARQRRDHRGRVQHAQAESPVLA